jgi:AAA domain
MAAGQTRALSTAVQPAEQNNLRGAHRLIGRDEDRSTLRMLVLEAPGRLVTLTGPGGVGKTELAILVANNHTETFSNGIWFVDVASVQTAELLPSAIASVLRLGPSSGKPLLNAVLDYLRASDMLLVLDNCEHLIAPARRSPRKSSSRVRMCGC